MKWPTILCAVCNKPVDYMVRFDAVDKSAQVLRVKCHGEWDEMALSDHDLYRMGPDVLRQLNEGVGIAFTTPRLTQEKAPDQSDRG